MKRISVFIGLKIAEIGGIIYVPYWLGKLWCFMLMRFDWANKEGLTGFLENWLFGIFIPMIIALVLGLIYGIGWLLWQVIYEFCKWNWEKADDIIWRYFK